MWSVKSAAEVEYTRVSYVEMIKKKDAEVARVQAIREEEKKRKEILRLQMVCYFVYKYS